MAVSQSGWRLWIAFAAALLLIVQGFTTASANAAGQSPVVLDAFGNPICLAGHIAGEANDGERSIPPDCCILLCSASNFSAGVLAKSAELAVQPILVLPRRDQPVSQILIAAEGYQPGNPRAPPFSA